MFDGLGRWLSDNNSLLSGIAAVAALAGIVIPVVGRSLRGAGTLFGNLRGRGAAPAPSNGSAADAPSGVASLAGPLLAVLPFDNFSNDPEMQFFCDGVSEEIIQRVSRGSRVKVIGRLSSFQFRGERKAEAAAQLHCSHLLDGSVRRHAERVRISTQLLESPSHTSLWSESYDRGLDDVFAIQDDISRNVARALDQAFARPETVTVDPAVYDLYLRALPKSYAPDELRTRVDLLEVVTQRAPDFAAAWGRLAYLRSWLHLYLPYRERPQNGRRVIEEAATALAADSGNIDALVAQIFVLPPYGHFAEMTALLERVRTLRGAADGMRYTGWFLRTTGRVREALDDAEHAYRLDALDPMSINLLALARMAAGQVAGAIPLYEDLVERVPGMSFPVSSLLRAYAFQADWAAVDRLLEVAAERQLRGFEDGLPFIRAKRDPTAANIAAYHDSVAQQVRATGCIDVARLVYTAHLGLVDEAMQFAASARLGPTGSSSDIMGPDAYRTSLLFQEGMPELRNDPRFPGLCVRLGLADYWLESDTWPDCVDQVPYDFKAGCAAQRGVEREPFDFHTA